MANVVVPAFTEAPSTVVGGTPQSAFEFDFPFWESADVLVYIDDVLQPVDAYTVEGAFIQNGEAVEGGYGSGTVTLNAAVSDCTVTIDRFVVDTRTSQFSRSSPLPMPALNADLNKLTAREQDLLRKLNSAIAAAGEALGLSGKAAIAANLGDLADRVEAYENLLFRATGTGAVSRSASDKAADVVSARDFGVIADATTADRAAMQAAINSFGILGGKLALVTGGALVDEGANDACVTVTNGVSLIGDGLYSAIQPAAGVANDVDTLLYRPSGPTEAGWVRFQNFTLGNYTNGTRAGGVGLHILTDQAGIVADRVLIEGVYVNPGADVALLIENDESPSVNPTGGFFCSSIRRSAFRGGVKLSKTGDSILFDTVTTTGPNIGVEVEGTMNATGDGPSSMTFLNHNSTSEEGAFLFHRAKQPIIFGANIEQTVAFAGVSVDFKGDTGPNNSTGVWAPFLVNSLVSGFTGVGLASLVNTGSVSGGVIWHNSLLDGGSATSAEITVGADTHDLWIGPNLSYRADIRITDNGVGTRGVDKYPTLTNGWSSGPGSAHPLIFTKSIDGWVMISGVAGGGTTTPGTVIFTLPVGFRPIGDLRPWVGVNDGGTVLYGGTLLILSTGEVMIGTIPTSGGAGAQQIHCAIPFRAIHANTITIPTPFVV